ncbi:hypothetical protein JCM18237_31040 [Halorubrum luteum]
MERNFGQTTDGSTWRTLLEEVTTIAEELDDTGWRTVRIRPGQVTTSMDSETFGVRLVIPSNDFEELADAVEAAAGFERFEIYKRTTGGRVYAVVVERDPSSKVAVLYPLYYSLAERDELVEKATQKKTIPTYLSTLQGERVVFTHEPNEFFRYESS